MGGTLKTLGNLTSEELYFGSTQPGFFKAVEEEFRKLSSLRENNTLDNSILLQDHNNPDCSSVILDTKKCSQNNDRYIRIKNLNYHRIDFFVTPAPTENTINEFCVMLFKKSRIIVQLRNPKKDQSYPEWNPKLGEYFLVGNLEIATIHVMNKSQYTQTTLLISDMTSKQIKQVYFFSYLQPITFGTPENETKCLEFLNMVHQKHQSLYQHDFQHNWITVFSDAQPGEIETLCTVINGFQSLEKKKKVNLYEIVRNVLGRPSNILQLNQYIFCYKLLIFYARQ